MEDWITTDSLLHDLCYKSIHERSLICFDKLIIGILLETSYRNDTSTGQGDSSSSLCILVSLSEAFYDSTYSQEHKEQTT